MAKSKSTRSPRTRKPRRLPAAVTDKIVSLLLDRVNEQAKLANSIAIVSATNLHSDTAALDIVLHYAARHLASGVRGIRDTVAAMDEDNRRARAVRS